MNKNKKGTIEVICGPMFSGKTEELIRRIKNSNKSYKVFKPVTDTRNKQNKIESHSSIKIDATTIKNINEVLVFKNKFDIIGIDEAQFFDNGIVKICNDLANEGIRVIVAGLDMDYKGNPFGPMPNLMAVAEFVTKVHAICTKTGNLAHFSHRTSENDDLVLLGERTEYEALSRAAFNKLNSHD